MKKTGHVYGHGHVYGSEEKLSTGPNAVEPNIQPNPGDLFIYAWKHKNIISNSAQASQLAQNAKSRKECEVLNFLSYVNGLKPHSYLPDSFLWIEKSQGADASTVGSCESSISGGQYSKSLCASGCPYSGIALSKDECTANRLLWVDNLKSLWTAYPVIESEKAGGCFTNELAAYFFSGENPSYGAPWSGYMTALVCSRAIPLKYYTRSGEETTYCLSFNAWTNDVLNSESSGRFPVPLSSGGVKWALPSEIPEGACRSLDMIFMYAPEIELTGCVSPSQIAGALDRAVAKAVVVEIQGDAGESQSPDVGEDGGGRTVPDGG